MGMRKRRRRGRKKAGEGKWNTGGGVKEAGGEFMVGIQLPPIIIPGSLAAAGEVQLALRTEEGGSFL